MKYCPFCGSGLQDAMVFCPKCGKRFLDAFENPETIGQLDSESSLPEYPEESTQGSASTQVVDDASKADSIPPKEPIRKPIKRKTGLVLLSAIFVVAVIALIFFGKNDDESGISITDAANSVLYLEVFDDKDNVIATASGFIIEGGKTLVTNYHVIEEAHHIVAHTSDGEKSVDICTILAYDQTKDLAILQCETDTGVNPLTIGNSELITQGDNIFAVGYPLGLANTLSDGVVSSRYIDENGVDTLQITAAISHGSSGGALLNEHGDVIGVICASYVDGQNLNIAIASAELSGLLETCNSNTPISMEDFYQMYYDSIPHDISVYEAISNRKELDGCEIEVHGYISSIEMLTLGTSDIHELHFYLVNSPSEVLGHTIIIEDWSTATDEQNRQSDYESQRWRDRECISIALVDGDPFPSVPLDVGMEITIRGILYNFTIESLGEDDVALEPFEYIF